MWPGVAEHVKLRRWRVHWYGQSRKFYIPSVILVTQLLLTFHRLLVLFNRIFLDKNTDVSQFVRLSPASRLISF